MNATITVNGVCIEPLMVGLIPITSCTKMGEYATIPTMAKKESKPAPEAVMKLRL